MMYESLRFAEIIIFLAILVSLNVHPKSVHCLLHMHVLYIVFSPIKIAACEIKNVLFVAVTYFSAFFTLA